MIKRMIFYVYNKCTKIYIVTDGFINTVTHSYEELTREEMVIAINKAIGKLIEERGINLSEYSKDYEEIYRFVEEIMSEFNLELKNYEDNVEETFMNFEYNKDII